MAVITATSTAWSDWKSFAAGIGGGNRGDGGNITITGGTVTATSQGGYGHGETSGGAGIGGGSDGSGGNITIKGTPVILAEKGQGTTAEYIGKGHKSNTHPVSLTSGTLQYEYENGDKGTGGQGDRYLVPPQERIV